MTNHKRKYPSHYGHQLQIQLSKEKQWVQAEKLPSFLPFFVGKDILTKLRNNTNHLICGKRGSGKTHILGAFDELINQDLNNQELSMKISCMDFSSTPPSIIDEDPDFKLAKYSRLIFKNFLKNFIEIFINNVSNYIENKLVKKYTKRDLQKIRVKCDNNLLELFQIIETGVPFHYEGFCLCKDRH